MHDSSLADIFQPKSAATYPFTATGAPSKVTVVNGPVVSEVRHVYGDSSIEQVFRLYNGSDTLEVEYRIGPIDVTDGDGKEVISHFDTDVASDNKFETDVNGMQVNTRTRDTRATLWPGGPPYFSQTDPVSGNYFAVNTAASLSDLVQASAADRRRFSVLIDRAEGGTSMAPGQLELMLHRRLTHGCRWGMCENNEQVRMAGALLGVLGVVKTTWLPVRHSVV